ncbi:glycine-rich domain-containing protein [Halomonas litopenaei]|uniref:glycoside hydrolase family 78 protein n=1 Tax=Halomonas litopenaei TaxID=2109328 RepID=UPI003FA162E3
MANIPDKENPGFPEVYVLEETDPVVGGIDGIDNLPHKQLAERDQHLLERVEPLEKKAGEHEERLQSVEISGSVSVGRAFPIWLAESDQGADFELFADAAYTWRDYPPAAIVATVSGDESVDVATTNNLVVGDAYVIIDDDGSTEVVEVEAILTATRFRATGTLSKTREATGTLARTSWDIRAGYALAGDGLYFSREIKTLRFDDAGRLILRRADGDGSVRVQARRTNAPATGWQNAPLKRSAATDGGVTDLEFRIPVGGTVELRIETERGQSSEPLEIHHLVCLPEVRAGRADAVRQPTNVTPAEGAVDVMETPTLTGDAYHSLYGVAHAAAEFEVATDTDFANIVYQGSEASAVVQHAVAGGTLSTDQVYWWRCRYQDAEGTWSPWSTPTGFATGSVFEYVAPPAISSPSADATGVSLLPTIVTGDFAAVGTADTHAASQYQVASDADFATIVYDSGTVADLTSHQLGDALGRETIYHVRARHQGQALGWSDWSVVVSFTTTNSADQPTITAPADGTTGVAFSDGVSFSASSFSFPGGGEAHVASDWELRDATSGDIVASSANDGSHLTSWDITGTSLDALTDYEVRVRYKGATTGYSPWSAWSAFTTAEPTGEAIFTSIGTHDWVVPAGVTSVSALCIAGGGGGGHLSSTQGGSGGGGGGLVYWNDVPVTPGETLSVVVGAGGSGASRGNSSGFSANASNATALGGVNGVTGANGDPGGSGGGAVGGTASHTGGEGGGTSATYSKGGGGGGGAAGYTADGGNGYGSNDAFQRAGGGGGVGLFGGDTGGTGGRGGISYGNGGAGGSGGSSGKSGDNGGHGGTYGGGGGGGTYGNGRGAGGSGAQGAVRIIWGPGRSFPDNAA